MGLFRIRHTELEQSFNISSYEAESSKEWESVDRITEPSWEERYNYEANLIINLIEENPNIKNVLELGPGPGVLAQKVLDRFPDLNYHLVDKPFAKEAFEKNNSKGTFFVKDLSNDFEIEGLLPKYDLVISNDFLEHIFNPHIILKQVHTLTDKDSIWMVSNPNWRLSHQYIYRGLYDFDNFIYMFYTHDFSCLGVYGSPLKTPDYPRLDSETLLPEEMRLDWNHYILFKHTQK
jgi:2-polyprenyl-3-methyl-5-hydroxy-6-metoxy-1,4-benzoquinol methylase